MEPIDRSPGHLARSISGRDWSEATSPELVDHIHTENNILFKRFAPAVVV